MTGKWSKNFHGVDIGLLSKILAVKTLPMSLFYHIQLYAYCISTADCIQIVHYILLIHRVADHIAYLSNLGMSLALFNDYCQPNRH